MDCDGVTSTALLTTFMQEAGAEVIPFMPSREDGYGVREKGLDVAFNGGADLIITADCGITAIEPAKICRDKGVKLVVTDHHLPGDTLPAADAVVNPQRSDCSFPFKGLAGVGVAFYLLGAVRKHLRDAGHRGGSIDMKSLLDLVTLG